MCGSTQEQFPVPPQRQTYRQIADDLTARIHSGEYPPGSELPSAVKLAEIYSVSRNTAQHALSLLKDRKLTVGVQGRATYVATDADDLDKQTE
jgi:GntR family transcriptional regulator